MIKSVRKIFLRPDCAVVYAQKFFLIRCRCVITRIKRQYRFCHRWRRNAELSTAIYTYGLREVTNRCFRAILSCGKFLENHEINCVADE